MGWLPMIPHKPAGFYLQASGLNGLHCAHPLGVAKVKGKIPQAHSCDLSPD